MSAASQRERSQKTAEDLKRRGIFHGKRMSKPYPDSGGLTMTWGPGSSKYKRRKVAEAVRRYQKLDN